MGYNWPIITGIGMAKLGALKYNEDYFVSAQQCARDDTPVFTCDGVKFAMVDGDRYRVMDTIKPREGLIQYFKSSR